jgi:hypothetical protein
MRPETFERKLDDGFTRDRFGHNGQSSWLSRITYMAHANGYVMARRPRCIPFVISEKMWLSFPFWSGQPDVATGNGESRTG